MVLGVTSFGLLAPPAAAAYYDVVRRSRRERFFIDLETVAETARSFLRGIRRHFLGGYVVAVLGLLPVAALLVVPVVVFEALGRQASPWTLLLLVLVPPAFFWAGAVLLYGYPCLAATGRGLAAIRHAGSAGRRHPLPPLLVGFLVLFPMTGAVFHYTAFLLGSGTPGRSDLKDLPVPQGYTVDQAAIESLLGPDIAKVYALQPLPSLGCGPRADRRGAKEPGGAVGFGLQPRRAAASRSGSRRARPTIHPRNAGSPVRCSDAEPAIMRTPVPSPVPEAS